MVDRDVVIAKISSVQRCLKRIKDVSGLNPDSLDNLDTQEIVILNIQRAVQGMIDIAAHIVADEGLGVPVELRENFEFLSREEIINKELSARLKKWSAFEILPCMSMKQSIMIF